MSAASQIALTDTSVESLNNSSVVKFSALLSIRTCTLPHQFCFCFLIVQNLQRGHDVHFISKQKTFCMLSEYPLSIKEMEGLHSLYKFKGDDSTFLRELG